MNKYTTGTLIELTASFALASNGNPENPTTIVCKVRDPAAVEHDVSSTITEISTGNYTATFLPALTGEHTYEWIGTGAVQAAGLNKFSVEYATF